MSNETQNDIMEKAFALSLSLRQIGNRRKVQVGAIADDSKEFDRTMIGVSKQLLDSAEYKAIGSFDGETKRWLYAHSLPCAFTGHGGMFMIPKKLFLTVYDTLTERAAKREQLVAKFVDRYPELVNEAREKLGPILFNEEDYPETSEVAHQFSMTWIVTEFRTPEGLSAIRREIYEREKTKAAAQWQSVTEDAMVSLREGFAKLVSKITERLSDPSKKFKDTLVSNATDFIETFQALNIGNDKLLEVEVKRAAQLLSGVRPDDLRTSLDVRKSVLDGMKQVEHQLESLIVDRPRRKVQIDDAA